MARTALFGFILMSACICIQPDLSSAQNSCHERCGEVYYRGHKCHCDYSCLIHKECCLDYEMTCTTGNSCKGRCGEDFQRGKQCDCDNECSQFGKCCPDYTMHCMNEHFKAEIPEETLSTTTTSAKKLKRTTEKPSPKSTQLLVNEKAKIKPTLNDGVNWDTLQASPTNLQTKGPTIGRQNFAELQGDDESVLHVSKPENPTMFSSKKKGGDQKESSIIESTSEPLLETVLPESIRGSFDTWIESSGTENEILANSTSGLYITGHSTSFFKISEKSKDSEGISLEKLSTVLPYTTSSFKTTNQPEATRGNGTVMSEVSETATSIHNPQTSNTASEMTKSYTTGVTTEDRDIFDMGVSTEHALTEFTVLEKLTSSQTTISSITKLTKKEESTTPTKLADQTKNTNSSTTHEKPYSVTAKTHLSSPEPPLPVISDSIISQTASFSAIPSKTDTVDKVTTSYNMQTSNNLFESLTPRTTLKMRYDPNINTTTEKPDASTFSSPITTTINNNLIGNSQTTNNVSDLPVPVLTTLSRSETPFMLSESILSKEKEGDLEELPISESMNDTYRKAELTTMLMKRQSPELNKSCDGQMDSSTTKRQTKLTKSSNARSYDTEQPLSSFKTSENCKHTDVQSPETVSTVVPYIESASKMTNQAPEEEENQPESSSGNGHLISDVSETTTSINKPKKSISASEMTKSFTKVMTTEMPGFIEHSVTEFTVEREIQASSQTAESSTMGSTKKEESTMPSELLKETKNTETAMTKDRSYSITAKTNLSNPEPTVPVNSASIITQTGPLVPRFTKTHNLEKATTIYELQTSNNLFKGVAPGTSLKPKSDQNIKDTTEKLETTFASPITPATIETTKNVSDALVPDHDDSNLCIGRPANGMTTLRNGTTFVFRGHFFWMLNARGIEVGYPRKITEVWGIPSPIDTVFTRCNCQGKTFFFKGKNYWRFENGSLDPGYPKLISKGFNGLSGKITAALSVSAHQRKMESVYFFKQGGVFQKYTFEQQPSNKCAKPSTSLSIKVIRKRTAREAGGNLKIKAYLTKEIAISSLSGIQTSITSAISVPNPKSLDGYNYFLFSKNKYYNIKFINSTMPSLSSVHSNAHKDWYKCL
ncbi:proteoglycan 4b isoform X2 [Polypterus senegalus]|uniref:proteoglycan 4b isoform X2 n=1 Tax=Polypterus senegalus TaxID=55291 RepID=UPI0019637032|nr:proteoglycan 4b isoform X2 [Polypterus senegalus]